MIGRHFGMLEPYIPEGSSVQRGQIVIEDGVAQVISEFKPEKAMWKGSAVFPIDFAVGEASIADERIFTGFIRDLTMWQKIERRVQELQSGLVHVSKVGALSTMASNLEHEINQPLTAIANYLEATRAMIGDSSDALLAEVAQTLDLAAAQSPRAGAIVRRLRAFVDGGESGFCPARLEELPSMRDDPSIVHIVDDDEAIRKSVGFLSRKAGYPVETYPTGATFLRAVTRATRGCVLLDVRMPDIAGLEVQATDG